LNSFQTIIAIKERK